MPQGYHRATEVMPVELARRAFSHLKDPCKITFAQDNGAMTTSEERLPADMVYEIRTALAESGLTLRRTIYFGPEMVSVRYPNAKAAAKHLVERKKMPILAVAATLGVADWTIRRWGIQLPQRYDSDGWPLGPRKWSLEKANFSDEEKLELQEAGLAHCKAMGNDGKKSIYGDHHIYVGVCLRFLEEWKDTQGEKGGKFLGEPVRRGRPSKEKANARKR